jgi:formamidopyrimidine-DNA glycosylase
MPELPEVETIRKSLGPQIQNAKILKIFIGDKKLRWQVDRDSFEKYVNGQTILNVSRRAKYLVWELDNKSHVVFHLGMSGRLGVFDVNSPIEKHTHVSFTLNNHKQIRFRDPRRFGFAEVLNPSQSLAKRFRLLGPEPLSVEFDNQYLYEKTRTSARAIKIFLMDSKIVVGIGNIYANEALFNAGIKPTKTSFELNQIEIKRLVESIKYILKIAIDAGGTTLKDYRNANGEPGFFQQKLAVYDRAGKACIQCGKIIEKIVIGQRSTFFCPTCQI